MNEKSTCNKKEISPIVELLAARLNSAAKVTPIQRSNLVAEVQGSSTTKFLRNFIVNISDHVRKKFANYKPQKKLKDELGKTENQLAVLEEEYRLVQESMEHMKLELMQEMTNFEANKLLLKSVKNEPDPLVQTRNNSLLDKESSNKKSEPSIHLTDVPSILKIAQQTEKSVQNLTTRGFFNLTQKIDQVESLETQITEDQLVLDQATASILEEQEELKKTTNLLLNNN